MAKLISLDDLCKVQQGHLFLRIYRVESALLIRQILYIAETNFYERWENLVVIWYHGDQGKSH